MPKAELHCHLDGSVRISTILELAEENGVQLPTTDPKELEDLLTIGENLGSLVDYLARFDITLSVLQTYGALRRVAYELAIDCWEDGVRYLEVRYSPILHLQDRMTLAETVVAVREGLEQAQEEKGILSGIIICGIRQIPAEQSLRLADLTVQFKNQGVVAFDLAGAEENFPAKYHQEAFDLILRNNINTTLHAGEAYGPESVHQAIHACGAHRIGHGTRLREDPELMAYVNDHRIALEICLTSNIHTRSVLSYADHPFKFYFDKHLRVTLNTDNRLISGTTLTDEYLKAIEMYDLGPDQIRELIVNGFKSAFMHHNDRRQLIRRVLTELETEIGFDRRVIV